MSIFGENAVKQRRRVSAGILVAAACLIGFVGGRISFEWQYPITKDATFGNLSYAYKEIKE